MPEASLDSFGRLNRGVRASRPASEMADRLSSMKPGSVLPFGNGRSYGDSCHNDDGTLADFRSLNRILHFNIAKGIVVCEAGVMLHDLIDLGAQHGWFLPVTPGTRFVTLGGAVANDVHGKNHHCRGTLGRHVRRLTLIRSDGVCDLEPDDPDGLFAATIGGMGLTGFIACIELQLMKVGSLDVDEKLSPFRTLDEYFEIADESDYANEYAVAWLDQINGDRGVLMTANHAMSGLGQTGEHKPLLSVPFDLPFNALNRWSLKAFNAAFNLAKSRSQGAERRTRWQSYFYPLDGVGHWNRLYGPKGLFQHQSVVPFDAGREAISALLEASRMSGQVSFLTVLKRFGALTSPGLMSFPKPGYTLTLDFPNRGEPTRDLLETLDRITLQAGGRVNPYKDARMSAGTFQAGFSDWRLLEAKRDPVITSDFWRRVTG